MIRHWATIVGVTGSLLCGAASAQEAKPPAGPAGDARAGKQLYLAIGCYECHGTVAQGSPRTGPTLLTTLPFAAFVKQLRRPVAEMPPYEASVVSDRQAADLYAYIQTLPKPADYKTITLLQ
jgi:mono/diheme cytochrome c family protein